MTENQRKDILNLSDTIKGEVNRMCVTNDIFELHDMASYARVRVSELEDLIHEAKFSIDN